MYGLFDPQHSEGGPKISDSSSKDATDVLLQHRWQLDQGLGGSGSRLPVPRHRSAQNARCLANLVLRGQEQFETAVTDAVKKARQPSTWHFFNSSGWLGPS